jgi:hypothetical protein
MGKQPSRSSSICPTPTSTDAGTPTFIHSIDHHHQHSLDSDRSEKGTTMTTSSAAAAATAYPLPPKRKSSLNSVTVSALSDAPATLASIFNAAFAASSNDIHGNNNNNNHLQNSHGSTAAIYEEQLRKGDQPVIIEYIILAQKYSMNCRSYI